jgi:tricarballylate dehydrogenase
MFMLPNDVDVVVVGAGNAAFCAALAAVEGGASVLMVEWAPKEQFGGNSRFSGGAIRCTYNTLDELLELMPDLPAELVAVTDFGRYSEAAFAEDIMRVTEGRADRALVETLVTRTHATLAWMRGLGVRFAPIHGRQAFKVDDRYRFWGGLTIFADGRGIGLVDALRAAALRLGIAIEYGTRATALLTSGEGITGIRVQQDGRARDVTCRRVVLASGGFEANTEWRTRYLGSGWDLAKVRGSRFNFGDGIRMALDAGALPWGQWSGCHAVACDWNAPALGDPDTGDTYQKHSYPFGLLLNREGKRFVDEGADFRNYTYAKYGRMILGQPGQVAWQIFDHKVQPLLNDEYLGPHVTRVTAQTLEELVDKLGMTQPEAALDTIREYNTAVRTATPFNPNAKDGRRTEGLAIPKSNWANTLDTPPFEAYRVTCGITFTFGGVATNAKAQILDVAGKPIGGLYAAGEMVGGLFYFNYPGGTGLTAGAVFGKIAGSEAALSLKRVQDIDRREAVEA